MNNNQRDLLIVIVGKIAQIILMLVTLKVSTYLLPPNIMGQVYIFTTIYTFFVFFLISPVGQYFNRYTHHWESEGVLLNRLYLYFAYMLIVCISSMLGAGIIHLVGVVNELPLFIFILLTGLFVLFVSANQTVLPVLNMLKHRFSFTLLTFLTAFFGLVFSVVFVTYFDKSSEFWLLGLLLGNGISLIIGLFFLQKILSTEAKRANYFSYLGIINKKNITNLVRFAAPVSFATAFMWAQNVGYRFSLEHYLSLDYLGLIGVGFMVATQLSSVVEAILMQYLQPDLYLCIKNADIKGRTQAVNRYLNITIPIYFALAIFLSFAVKYIFPVLVSGEYQAGYLFCIFGVWIEFFRMVTNAISTIAHSEVKMKGYMYPYIFGAVITNFLVYCAVISSVDYTTFVPIAIVAGAFITCFTMCVNMRKLMPFTISYWPLLLSGAVTLPCALYFSFVSFTPVIGISYFMLLCLGGFLFLMGLITLYFIDRKIHG